MATTNTATTKAAPKAKPAAKPKANTEAKVKAAPKVKAPKVERVSQNAVTRPAAGTSTARVWEIADELSAKANAPTPRADVVAAFVAEGGNPSTGATQYGRWCKFHGITRETQKALSAKKTEEAPAKA